MIDVRLLLIFLKQKMGAQLIAWGEGREGMGITESRTQIRNLNNEMFERCSLLTLRFSLRHYWLSLLIWLPVIVGVFLPRSTYFFSHWIKILGGEKVRSVVHMVIVSVSFFPRALSWVPTRRMMELTLISGPISWLGGRAGGFEFFNETYERVLSSCGERRHEFSSRPNISRGYYENERILSNFWAILY